MGNPEPAQCQGIEDFRRLNIILRICPKYMRKNYLLEYHCKERRQSPWQLYRRL